jgi:hypothetical protein
MTFRLTRHALQMAEERLIDLEWIRQTLETPADVVDDPAQVGIKWYFGRIEARGGRWLRVVARQDGDDVRVITVFFDRGRAKR